MSRWSQRIRGAIGVGLIWAAAWFAAGMGLLLVVGPHAADVPFPLFFGLLGFLAGTVFSGLLARLARHRRFDQLSLPRFAGWGALAGVVVAAGVNWAAGPGNLLGLMPLFAAASATSAVGTLVLARRAEARARDAMPGSPR